MGKVRDNPELNKKSHSIGLSTRQRKRAEDAAAIESEKRGYNIKWSVLLAELGMREIERILDGHRQESREEVSA